MIIHSQVPPQCNTVLRVTCLRWPHCVVLIKRGTITALLTKYHNIIKVKLHHFGNKATQLMILGLGFLAGAVAL